MRVCSWFLRVDDLWCRPAQDPVVFVETWNMTGHAMVAGDQHGHGAQ